MKKPAPEYAIRAGGFILREGAFKYVRMQKNHTLIALSETRTVVNQPMRRIGFRFEEVVTLNLILLVLCTLTTYVQLSLINRVRFLHSLTGGQICYRDP